MIDKLSFLKSGLESGGVSAEEERLMHLFQNRAGLKKAYADLKDEFHLLRDRLKQQEGATIRVQEQLDALADLLADPRTAFGALVFFQLRGLWKTCHQQLSNFASDLTRQQELRESARHKADCETLKSDRLKDVDERLAAASGNADAERGRLAEAQRELDALTAFWHYFRRRRQRAAVDALRHSLAAADAAVGELHAERSAIANEALAEFPGISLNARRNINLAIISYAESLCENADAFGLTAIAKEAVARRVHEMSFGTREECEGYMLRVQRAMSAVSNHKQVLAGVRGKLERLRGLCEYRNAADTVPSAESLAAAAARVEESRKGAASGGWNVLAEDYWDLYTLLLR